ncbi:hypothetical protein AB0L33_30235 [Streptomyces sp. NPDC052299]|uniref:hypothetical protein n=1 Tax=Streptomyces sp. NPDC052299 TaxID=3155054 RepID=UPI0034264D8F
MKDMSQNEFLSAQIRRAWEPPEEVVVPAPLAFSPDLQPEDYGVLLRLLLRDPELPSAVNALAAEFQASGWKMGDTRLRGVMKRLRKAGHVHRERDGYDAEAGRPRWAFAVYRNPANNPDRASPRASTSSQVSPTRGFSTERRSTPRSDALDSNVYAGQRDTLDSSGSESDTLESDALDSNVYAGQRDTLDSNGSDVAPPTPPYREEEDSSSPTSSSVTAVPAGAPATDATAIAAASEFLAELPGHWACGRRTAAEFAPLLAEAVQAQGWELGADLVQQLTRRASARRGITSVLRERIEDLPRYRAVRRALEQARSRSAAGQVPGQQLALEDQADAQGAAALPEDVSPERVEEARVFLLTLTGPWELPAQSAQRLAPKLASVTAERGWEFNEQLRQALMANPGGGQNYEWLLEHRRIATLPDRTRKARASRPAAKAGMCTRHPDFRAEDCHSCLVIKRRQERAAKAAAEAAADAGPDTQSAAAREEQVPADVAAYVQGLAAGATADEAARRGEPVLTDWERQHLAQETEHARRLQAHDAALNV